MNPYEKLKSINDLQADKALESRRHEDMKSAFFDTQETILKAFNSLVEYLDNKVTKAEVVNQLTEIGTPDALAVVEAVNNLQATIESQEKTDLSPVVTLIQQVLEEAKKIPKELPTIPENEKQIDYSKQFKAMSDAVRAVETAVKAQELKVDAPIVNVPETVLNVEAPDLSKLEKGNKALEKAIKGIVIPEYKPTDITPLLKEQKRTNKILEDMPVGGGGGGSSLLPYQDPDGKQVQVVLTDDGKIPVEMASTGQELELINAIRVGLQQIAMPSWFDPSTNTLRVGTTAVTISSGTVTTVTTVGTVTTLTKFGTNEADVMARDTSINTWANTVRSTIT